MTTDNIQQELFTEAREGHREDQRALIDSLFWSKKFEHAFSLLEPSDVQWLRRWASERHDAKAITLLLVGMENRFSTWDEDFTDEDTGEPFTYTHAEKVEGETLFPSAPAEILQLYNLLTQNWQQTESRVLHRAIDALRCWTSLNYTVLLHHLADEAGDGDAQTELAEAYRYGHERNGIYRNLDLARKYYDMTGDTCELEEEDEPCEYDYTLTGDADTLSAIKRLIDDLCRQFGTPDNELGLYIPLQAVMKVLVGSPYYRGNILRMEAPLLSRKGDACLILRVEANSGNPLCYAIEQSFTGVNVEISHICE